MKPKREDQFTALHAMLRALADPMRLRIVGLLTGGEVCVCHIRDARHSAAQSLAASGLPSTVRVCGVAAGWTVGPLSACADQDPVVRTLFDSAVHSVGHLETITRDRKRLEKEPAVQVLASRPNRTAPVRRAARSLSDGHRPPSPTM